MPCNQNTVTWTTNVWIDEVQNKCQPLSSWSSEGQFSFSKKRNENVIYELNTLGILIDVKMCLGARSLFSLGAFGSSLTSDLTLVSPAFGWPDLASELPLVPRVQFCGAPIWGGSAFLGPASRERHNFLGARFTKKRLKFINVCKKCVQCRNVCFKIYRKTKLKTCIWLLDILHCS